MVFGFVLWSLMAGIFACIGVSCRKSEIPVGFYTVSKRPAVKDVKKYNHAVSMLWLIAAAVLEIAGVPILFLEQNSPLFIPITLAVMILALAMMAAYARIESKYRI